MTRRRNITNTCPSCKGRGWRDKRYPNTTIESLMPGGEHAYMCPSCHSTGLKRAGSRRIAMTHRFGRNKIHRLKVDRNSIWRIYRTWNDRALALNDIQRQHGGRLSYINTWTDVNGYGLHVLRNQATKEAK
jgi:hypothetical protein